jgi:hypothetical protein
MTLKGSTKTAEAAKQAKDFPFPLVSDKSLTTFKAYRAYDDFEKMALHGNFSGGWHRQSALAGHQLRTIYRHEVSRGRVAATVGFIETPDGGSRKVMCYLVCNHACTFFDRKDELVQIPLSSNLDQRIWLGNACYLAPRVSRNVQRGSVVGHALGVSDGVDRWSTLALLVRSSHQLCHADEKNLTFRTIRRNNPCR